MDETVTKKQNILGTAPIGGLIRKFAIPSIISLLINAIYNMTDQIFIGNVVGMIGNAATNVAFPSVTFTGAFAQLAGIGTAAGFNMCMGAKNEDEAKQYVGTGLALMGLLGLFILAVVLVFKMSILRLCGATDSIMPYADSYLGITAFGYPLFLFTMASSVLIRADGSPKYSMSCMISGAVVNVFLDWLFMYPLGMGIKGAAIATVCGQAISFAMCFCYFFRFKAFKITFGMLKLKLSRVFAISKLGASNCLNHALMMFVNIILNNTLSYYGGLSIYGTDIPLAVSGVLAKLNMILMSVSVGLAHGCQPIFSFNKGAKKYDRVKKAYVTAVKAVAVVGIVAFALFQLFPRQITGIFGEGSELYFDFAEKYIRIYMMMVLVIGVQPLT
ncbi:MAG: MATE family efflux transporter, partial [Clostridia bacterium]|nr:MATE family efflux transporter [Clostridia bacterium]